MHACKVGDITWQTTLRKSDISLGWSLHQWRAKNGKWVKLVSTQGVQACTLHVQALLWVHPAYLVEWASVALGSRFWAMLVFGCLGPSWAIWILLLGWWDFSRLFWLKAHESAWSEFRKLGHIWDLGDYFGIWALLEIGLGLGLGTSSGKRKKDFFPNLYS